MIHDPLASELGLDTTSFSKESRVKITSLHWVTSPRIESLQAVAKWGWCVIGEHVETWAQDGHGDQDLWYLGIFWDILTHVYGIFMGQNMGRIIMIFMGYRITIFCCSSGWFGEGECKDSWAPCCLLMVIDPRSTSSKQNMIRYNWMVCPHNPIVDWLIINYLLTVRIETVCLIFQWYES